MMHIPSLRSMCSSASGLSTLASTIRTILQDDCGHTWLRTSATSFQPSYWSTSDPFAFPSHVEQCFYIPYPPDPEEWSLVVTYVPRFCSIVGEKPDFVITSTVEVDEDHI